MTQRTVAHLYFTARYSYILYRPPFLQTWHTSSWPLLHMFQFFCTKSLNRHYLLWKVGSREGFHQVNVSAAHNSSHQQWQQKHRTWEGAAIKALTCWVATEQTMRKARGDFHVQSFRLDRGEGKGEVFPRGWAVNQTRLNHSIWEICQGGVPASCWGELPLSSGDS